jgi:hypothetical protein
VPELRETTRAVNDILEKFMKDVDKDKEDGLAPDVVETWKGQAYAVVKEAVEFFEHFSEGDPASKPEDSLGPLRKAIGAATHLAEAVTKEVQDPSEERCGISPGSWGLQRRK